MALTDESGNGMVMPVTPMGNNGNNGFFGGDGAWIILFFIAMMFGGYGNGWGGNGGFNGGLGTDFPWLLNANNNTDALVTAGFANQSTQNALNGIQSAVTSGFGDVQTALCGGFAGVNATVNGAQNAISQQLYSGQLADLNRSFDSQTAITQGMNSIAMNQQNCCCENRASIADLKYTVATENCADRAALSDGLRDVIANQTSNTQRILDKLCDQELQAERRENQNLRSELMYARGQASQVDQTAQIRAGQNATMSALVNELRSCPIPSQPVYGSQPIFTCPNNNNGCGCGCGSF
jgi:hypothetical protein